MRSRASLAASLRGVLLLAVPASIGLILLRKPLVVLLYQRGEFDAYSTELVAWALLWYAAGLVGHSLVEILRGLSMPCTTRRRRFLLEQPQ